MARNVDRLTARKVATVTAAGLHADGNGLYLRISKGKSSGKRWVFIYRRPSDGKRCELGFGGTSSVSLARAREKAAEARAQIADGRDPRLLKDQASTTPTFGEMADKHIATMEGSWRNDKHRAQWKMTLAHYAKPLRQKPVDQIDTADVLDVLHPIWQSKPETASRVRGRIEKVLDASKVQGYRTGENPAAWRGHLALILPKPQKLVRGHHARMPIDALPAFFSALREREAVAARCLEFLMLTAARTAEALGARWDEIDDGQQTWTIPPHRMKPGREHRVPLTKQCAVILSDMRSLSDGDYVFPGQRRGKPLSSMSLAMLLRRMNVEKATVHGFRSCFRDWAGNRTDFPRELAEHALSHVIGDKAEQAYRRDDAVERRRPMMEAWADYCYSSKLSELTVVAGGSRF